MLWKIKTWVKTGISWDWLLLKAAIWLYVGGLQSLLPVIKLLKSGGRFFVDSAKKKKKKILDPASRSDASECTGSQKCSPLLHTEPGSGGCPPALDNYGWEQDCAAEIIDVMHCHLLCLFSHYHRKLYPGRCGARNKTITACHSHRVSRRDCIRMWRTDTMHTWKQKAYTSSKGPKFCTAKETVHILSF